MTKPDQVPEVVSGSERSAAAVVNYYRKPVWAEGAISAGDAEFLFQMLVRSAARSVAEIGIASGVSTAFLSRSLSEIDQTAELVSFDLATQFYADRTKRVGQFLWEEFGKPPPNTTLKAGVGSTEAAGAHEPRGPYEMVFIDGNHYDPWAAIDTLCMLPKTAPGAWIVLHDVTLHLQPDKALEYGPHALYTQWPGEKVSSGTASANIAAIRLFTDKGLSAECLLRIISNGSWTDQVDHTDRLAILRIASSVLPESHPLIEALKEKSIATGQVMLGCAQSTSDLLAHGTEAALKRLQSSIEKVIRVALEERVTLRSSVAGVTITGNGYQTVRLGGALVGRLSRGSREHL